jgi:hypothetical protein
MVMRISYANSLWVFADTPLENCTGVPYKNPICGELGRRCRRSLQAST